MWTNLITTIDGIHIRRNIYTREIWGSDSKRYEGVKVYFWGHDRKHEPAIIAKVVR